MADAAPLPEELEDGEELNATEVYSDYECTSLKQHASLLVKHPGHVSEPASLALVRLPPPQFPLFDSVPIEVFAEGKLSDLQTEGVLYACQRHQMILPNGCRAGFFLGDGAGVGKGRQISGIIFDSLARGRRKHVWLSTSSDLKLDAERDMNALGCFVKVIDGCQQLDDNTKALGLSSDFKEGVLFSTYSTLIGGAKPGRPSRLEQIVKWCGGETFDGVLVFDECHRAKNFFIGENSDASTKTSKCVIEIQKRLPLARVVYSSATGVTELGNLAYCERLGLWGEACTFANFEQFLSTVSRRGVFFLEMLAMELKRIGAYVSRGLSFQNSEFHTVELKLSDQQRHVYDEAASLWLDVRIALQEAIQKTNAPGRILSNYWSAHQRFFRQLILAMKVDYIAAEAKKAVEEGHAVVIGLQQTGEAALSRKISQKKSVHHFNSLYSSVRDTLISFLETHFPVIVHDASTDALNDSKQLDTSVVDITDEIYMNNVEVSKNKQSAGQTVESCLKNRDDLIRRTEECELPSSALDLLIDQLGGPDRVAEMTGRTWRIVREKGNTFRVEQRGKGEAEIETINVKECQKFQAGKKLIGIISDAASVGISLHALKDGGNQRRRVHFTLELPWSADKAVQQLGRSHRSNQVSAPIYRLVVTDIGGERRFASAVARRLESLGALTRGDRRAAVGQDLQEFNLQTVYGNSSLKKLMESIQNSTLLVQNVNVRDLFEITGDTSEEDLLENFRLGFEYLAMSGARSASEQGNVKKFLGRLLAAPVTIQNCLFQYFFCLLQHEICMAKREGRYSDAISDLFHEDSVQIDVLSSEEVYSDPTTSAKTSVHNLRIDRGMSWDSAIKKLRMESKGSKNDGFYETRHKIPGRNVYGIILAICKDDASFIISRPNTGLSKQEISLSELHEKYVQQDSSEAERSWKTLFVQSESWDGNGSRILNFNLVSGTLISIWNEIQEVVTRHSRSSDSKLSVRDARMKVVRIAIDGRHLVGLRLPCSVVADIKEALRSRMLLRSGQAVKILPPDLGAQGILALKLQPNTNFLLPILVGDSHIRAPVRYDTTSGSIKTMVPIPDGKQIEVSLSIAQCTSRIPVVVPYCSDDSKSNFETRVQVEEVCPVMVSERDRATRKPASIASFFKKSDHSVKKGREEEKSRLSGTTSACSEKAGEAERPVANETTKAKRGIQNYFQRNNMTPKKPRMITSDPEDLKSEVEVDNCSAGLQPTAINKHVDDVVDLTLSDRE